MSRNIFIAIAAAIVGALIVVFYYIIVPPAPLPPPGAPVACNTPNCPIAVTVYGDCSNANVIAAYPDPLPVKRGNGNPNIEWTIGDEYPYTFAANGIDFHGDPQFTNGNRQGPKKFKWMDKNSDDQYHKYAINLLRADGSACPTKDPGIINGR